CLRVEIFGDDRCHATGLDAPRADGSARPAHRFLIFSHEARRPGQALERHARESTAAEVAVRPTLIVDPMLHVLRQFHCLVSLVRNSSSGHALSGSVGSGVPVTTTTVPSGSTS